VSEAQDFAREADALLERITLLFAGNAQYFFDNEIMHHRKV